MADSFKTGHGLEFEDRRMSIELTAARAFVATYARILDRRRLQLLLGDEDPDGVLAALDGYRNPDGGYGWGLEPDLRSAESQTGAALHAFEVFAEAGPTTTPRASKLCDWLASVTLPGGGLPFSMPVNDPHGCAPWWAEADNSVSSLQITSIVVANALRVARHDASVARHPWLRAATDYCLQAIANLNAASHALEMQFALRMLDAVGETIPEAPDLLSRIGGYLPADGIIHVEGGTEGETLRPLDFAPEPGRPVRELFSPEVILSELERLANEQQADGGWPYEPRTFSPASALEWRGYTTVRAVWILQRNGMLD